MDAWKKQHSIIITIRQSQYPSMKENKNVFSFGVVDMNSGKRFWGSVSEKWWKMVSLEDTPKTHTETEIEIKKGAETWLIIRNDGQEKNAVSYNILILQIIPVMHTNDYTNFKNDRQLCICFPWFSNKGELDLNHPCCQPVVNIIVIIPESTSNEHKWVNS